jgi:hypothetical protein
MSEKLHFGDYLKEAFVNRWNLLLLGASVAGAMISGQPDIVLPLVGAAELAYLGVLASNKRFQWIVKARRAHAQKSSAEKERATRYRELYVGLTGDARRQFDQLKARCEVLQDLAAEPNVAAAEVATSRLIGVNRLLWVYLKLLHTQQRLERFFDSTDESEILQLEESSQRHIERLRSQESEDAIAEKKLASLEDTLQTARARRANLELARKNYEFVNVELKRIAAKLSGLAEMAVSHQDPSVITRNVDDVVESVEATEEAIGELQSFTGLTALDEGTPTILDAKDKARMRQKAGH